MKKKSFTDNLSSVVFMWIAFGLACLAIIMMFCPALKIDADVRNSQRLFLQSEDGYVAGWPTFVGYLLIAIGALMVAFTALPFFKPTIKTEKNILIIAGSFLVIGAFTCFFSTITYLCMTGRGHMIPIYDVYAGPFLAGSFSILAAGSTFFALKLDL